MFCAEQVAKVRDFEQRFDVSVDVMKLLSVPVVIDWRAGGEVPNLGGVLRVMAGSS